MTDVLRIDAHQHFWQFNEVKDAWITPEMDIIRRNFMPSDLQPILAENGIDACVAVQADQSFAENDFLLNLAASNDFIKGIVGWIDPRSENIEAYLELYSGNKIMKGFRYILQAETDRELMLRPDFKRGISHLSKYNFTYDLVIHPDQLPYAFELIEAFPQQKFVLDHVGKPNIKSADINNWRKQINTLGELENLSCKVSGLATEADWKNWQYQDFVPYLETVFNSFGAGRVMYGNDWPVCNLAGGYRAAKSIADQYTATLTTEENKLFWGGNAANFYNL